MGGTHFRARVLNVFSLETCSQLAEVYPGKTSAPHLCHNKLATCTSSAPAAVASARSPLVEHNADAPTVVTARNTNVTTDHSSLCFNI